MARGGFFSRIRSLFRGEPRPAPPSGRHARPQERERRDFYRQVWHDEPGKSGSYSAHRRFFDHLMDELHETDPEERRMLWESYVHNVVRSGGTVRRNSVNNLFWRDVGLHPDDFDWAAWREAMGYTGERRSNTP